MNYVTCNKCNWVSFEVSLEYVHSWEQDWVKYGQEWDEERLAMYGVTKNNLPTIEKEYLKCHRCGNSYKDFRDTLPGEEPCGSTVSGLLARKYDFKRI